MFWIVLSILYLLIPPLSLSSILGIVYKKGNQKGSWPYVIAIMFLMVAQALCYGFFPQLFSLINLSQLSSETLAFFLLLLGIELTFLIPTIIVFLVGLARLKKGRPVPTIIY